MTLSLVCADTEPAADASLDPLSAEVLDAMDEEVSDCCKKSWFETHEMEIIKISQF